MQTKGFLILLIAIVAILGSWYLEHSHGSADSTPAAHAQEVRRATAAAVTSQADTGTYTDADLGISFLLPDHWHCGPRKNATSDTKAHFQILCDKDGTQQGDPLAAVSVPLAHVTPENESELRHGTIGADPANQIIVTEYEDTRYPGTGSVSYVHGEPGNVGSYEVSQSYGPGKPYATAAEAEQYLGPLAQSIELQ